MELILTQSNLLLTLYTQLRSLLTTIKSRKIELEKLFNSLPEYAEHTEIKG